MQQKRQNPKLRIANVSYLNSVPFRVVRELPNVSYSEHEPTECARMLHEGESDLACIPIAEYFGHGGYSLLPFGIVANGPVESVMLFSKKPLECLETVLLDSSSQTSILLLRILLEEWCPEKAKMIRLLRMPASEAVEKIGDQVGALIIGDRALKYRGRFPYEIDLALSWKQCTGLPFVFAVWGWRLGRIQADLVQAITKAFEKGIGEERGKFAREWAEACNFPSQEAVNYAKNRISYQLDKPALEGALEFLRRGAVLGFFPSDSFERIRSDFENAGVGTAIHDFHGNGTSPRKILPFPNVLDFQGKPSPQKTSSIWGNELDRILENAGSGKRISIQEGIQLATRATLFDLALAADLRRNHLHPSNRVSYIVDRNINYTNVCNVYCRFCAFYRAPGKEGGYILTKGEIGKKIEETLRAGGIQILLQGGLNPELGLEYYEDLFRWIKENYPVNLHALSADEIIHISRVSKLNLEEVLRRLIAAGLGSLPGGGAEILVDRVRRRIARLKTTSEQWLCVHRSAHHLGLISTCTMMFGVNEVWEDRLLHLYKLRHLQDETEGFTAFIAWPFQDEYTKLKRGDTSAPEYLRVQAVARLFLDNIPNLQSSWVTQGPAVGQVALFFGANDFGSVMFEENVVSSAGTTYSMDSDSIEHHVLEAGFWPWRRDVHYNPQ